MVRRKPALHLQFAGGIDAIWINLRNGFHGICREDAAA
jgi:hypothetical protein